MGLGEISNGRGVMIFSEEHTQVTVALLVESKLSAFLFQSSYAAYPLVFRQLSQRHLLLLSHQRVDISS